MNTVDVNINVKKLHEQRNVIFEDSDLFTIKKNERYELHVVLDSMNSREVCTNIEECSIIEIEDDGRITLESYGDLWNETFTLSESEFTIATCGEFVLPKYDSFVNLLSKSGDYPGAEQELAIILLEEYGSHGFGVLSSDEIMLRSKEKYGLLTTL